jgi:CheY-like chemotaxis protein
MPGMHGVEFIRQVKKKCPTLPIIAMSAYDHVKKPFAEFGANLFLQKPFDPYVLEKEIELIAKSAHTAD